LAKVSRIAPNPDLVTIKIPDATPEIIAACALSDEPALLTEVGSNRPIDIFPGITACSMRSRLRTSVKETGQIEIDEVYVGIDRVGAAIYRPGAGKGRQRQTRPGPYRAGYRLLRREIPCARPPRRLGPVPRRRSDFPARTHP